MIRGDAALYLMYHDLKAHSAYGKSDDYNIPMSCFRRQMASVREVNMKACRAIVVPTFDDGKASNLEAAKLLYDMGIRGIFFIITNKVNCSGYLSGRDVLAIRKMGHVVGSHSWSHARFPLLSDEEARSELRKSKDFIERLSGGTCDSFAFPGGQFMPRHIRMAEEVGYKNIFTSIEGIGRGRRTFFRMHVRNSTLDYFDKILEGNRLYYAKRRWRSYLSYLKSVVVTKIGMGHRNAHLPT